MFHVHHKKNARKRIQVKYLLNLNPTGTPLQIHVDSTSILRRYVEQQISTNFFVISTYFFDLILLIEKSTLFPRTFFDAISMAKKFMWFPRPFIGLILLVEKSMSFAWTFLDVISMVEKSTLFPRTFF